MEPGGEILVPCAQYQVDQRGLTMEQKTPKAQFDNHKVIPFGCLVDYLPKPAVVLAMPKFEARACQGIFVGYYLQPGGEWKGYYLVFPLGSFDEYNYGEPRRLTELHPVRTMEAKLTQLTSFPMKPKYDLVKRTLLLTIIRPAEFYQHGDAVDVPGETTTDAATEEGVPAGIDEGNLPRHWGCSGFRGVSF